LLKGCDVSQLVTKGELKAILGISTGDTLDDLRLESACDAATAQIQAECGRQFITDAAVSPRVFVAGSALVCEVDDISTTSGLVIKTDEDNNGTFETTWVATDYQLEPLNARLEGQVWPYTQIRAIDARLFPGRRGQALVQVTARWGWPAVPKPVLQAAQIQAVSIFKSADAPLGVAGFGDIGVVRLRQAMHPVAMSLLSQYRRDPVLVA
jgi:hypothetical protein